MLPPEIVLPDTEPEMKWVRGRALQKVSPTRDHSRLQTEFASALNAWSRGRGEVGTEWRFRVPVPREGRRPLVPDIAFADAASLRNLNANELQVPPIAPTVAVEILSPGDDPRDVAAKIDAYLRAGTLLAIVVDPHARTIALHDALRTLHVRAGDRLTHAALPAFDLDVAELLALALGR